MIQRNKYASDVETKIFPIKCGVLCFRWKSKIDNGYSSHEYGSKRNHSHCNANKKDLVSASLIVRGGCGV